MTAMDALKEMEEKAEQAAHFFSGLASPHRLRILCRLCEGEKSVSELIAATGIPQTSMSQHLSKLRDEGIVAFRRQHRILYYYISDPMVVEIMSVLHGRFCPKSDTRDSEEENHDG